MVVRNQLRLETGRIEAFERHRVRFVLVFRVAVESLDRVVDVVHLFALGDGLFV